jgi:excisionase family DNA binding protein
MLSSFAHSSDVKELSVDASAEQDIERFPGGSEELNLDVLRRAGVLLDRLGPTALTSDVRVALSYLYDELSELRETGRPASTWPGWARSADLIRVLDATSATSRGSLSAHPATGQVFADLLLLGALACEVPVALLSVPQPDGKWSTLWHGTNIKDNRENDQLFEILAAADGPVELADLFTSVPRSPLLLAPHSLRWSHGVPLRNEAGELLGVTALLDTLPRHASNRERQAIMPLARQLIAQLMQRRRLAVDGLASGGIRLPQSTVADLAPLSQPNPGLSRKLVRTNYELLGSKQVAAMFCVTQRTIINWAAAGKIPSHRTLGGQLRFRHDVLDELSPMTRSPATRPNRSSLCVLPD